MAALTPFPCSETVANSAYSQVQASVPSYGEPELLIKHFTYISKSFCLVFPKSACYLSIKNSSETQSLYKLQV